MTVWRLYTTLTSPFGRKARIAAALCGLGDRITLAPVDIMAPDPSFRARNPLAKIPVLVDEEGDALFDSRVILEWLDGRAGGGVILPAGPARFHALRMQALADGIGDAWLLQIYERRLRSPDMRSEVWIERQRAKTAAGLAHFEGAGLTLSERPHVGEIALACMLGLGDSHFGGAWRRDHPALVAWLDRFAARVPAYAGTHVEPVPT